MKRCSVDGCTRTRFGHGYCNTHYLQVRRTGGLLPRRTSQERFWTLVDKGNGCWLWRGPRTSKGYGNFWHNGGRMYAHRYSWEILHDPIAEGLCVLHRCDTPLCVNPTHLFLGTRADNIEDCRRKGRTSKGDAHPKRRGIGVAKGAQHGRAKLTDEQVQAIRTAYQPGRGNERNYAALAKHYGVNKTQIMRVVRRITWKHLP